MLCLAYQRVDFLKQLNLFKPKRIGFGAKHLEILYGFSTTRNTLHLDFPNDRQFTADINIFKKLNLFTTMTKLETSDAVDLEDKRKKLNEACYRIKKSDSFLPKVRARPHKLYVCTLSKAFCKLINQAIRSFLKPVLSCQISQDWSEMKFLERLTYQ